MGFKEDELLRFHHTALAAAAAEGGEGATPEFHDFESVPVLAGTIEAIDVIELDALSGVKPCDEKGNVVKGAKSCGMYRATIRTPDDIAVSFLIDNGSVRAQFRAATKGAWTHPAQPLTPDAMRTLPVPPLVGLHVFVTLTGHWKMKADAGDATNKRMSVMTLPDREAMLRAWDKFRAAIRHARKLGAESPAAPLLEGPG